MKCPLIASVTVILAVTMIFSPVNSAFATTSIPELLGKGQVLEPGVLNTFSAQQIEGIFVQFEMCGLGDDALQGIYAGLTEERLPFYQILINMITGDYDGAPATKTCGLDLSVKYMKSASIDGFITGSETIDDTIQKQLRNEPSALHERDMAVEFLSQALMNLEKAELSAGEAAMYAAEAVNATTSEDAYKAADLAKVESDNAMLKAIGAQEKADKAAQAAAESAAFAELAGTTLALDAAAEAAEAAILAQKAADAAMVAAESANQSYLEALAAADALFESEQTPRNNPVVEEPVTEPVTEPVVKEPVTEPVTEPVVKEPVVEEKDDDNKDVKEYDESESTKCMLGKADTKKQFKKLVKEHIKCLKDELKQQKYYFKDTLSKEDFKEKYESLKDDFKEIKKDLKQQVKDF